MARESIKIPESYKSLGVEYVVDVDDNQKIWREYCALMERARDTLFDESRRAELMRAFEPKVAELFTVRILPYSHEEYALIESAHRKMGMNISIDRKRQKMEINGDHMSIAESTALDVCKKRVLEVKNYFAIYLELDEEGRPQMEDGHYKIKERKAITTGVALAEHIERTAWEEERAVLDDIFEAIRSRSHLELGEKKTFASLRS